MYANFPIPYGLLSIFTVEKNIKKNSNFVKICSFAISHPLNYKYKLAYKKKKKKKYPNFVEFCSFAITQSSKK